MNTACFLACFVFPLLPQPQIACGSIKTLKLWPWASSLANYGVLANNDNKREWLKCGRRQNNCCFVMYLTPNYMRLLKLDNRIHAINICSLIVCNRIKCHITEVHDNDPKSSRSIKLYSVFSVEDGGNHRVQVILFFPL